MFAFPKKYYSVESGIGHSFADDNACVSTVYATILVGRHLFNWRTAHIVSTAWQNTETDHRLRLQTRSQRSWSPHTTMFLFDQTHTHLNSQSLRRTNGWWAGWRALSQFAYVPHNLFSWVCPLCSIESCACMCACMCARAIFAALWLWLSPCPCGTSTSVIQWHTVRLLLLDRGSQRH